MTTHVVQWSTGLASAEVSRRLVEAHGVAAVHLVTADTLVEDEDNWRFATEAWEFIGRPHRVTVADGRTPMEAGRDERVVPNNRMAVCSKLLKRKVLRDYLTEHYDPADTVVHLGYDWTEPQRWTAAQEHWARLGWTPAAILTAPPYVHKAMLVDQWRAYGIEPPRLYALGFGHANCGGACVRGGQAQWELLLTVNRPRYLAWEVEEQTTRDLLGKDVSILRDRSGGGLVPLTLRRFRERLDVDAALFDSEDWGACGCDLGADS